MTDSTVDAAKLLPCPFQQKGYPHDLYVRAIVPGEYRARCSCGAIGPCAESEADAARRWNTRPHPAPLDYPDIENHIPRQGWKTEPQPAPPAGEPDFDSLLAAFVEDKKYQWWTNKYTIEFGNLMYRLGLAARPKVEDAEVAELVTKLRRALGWSKSRDGLCKEAADLLERLPIMEFTYHGTKC